MFPVSLSIMSPVHTNKNASICMKTILAFLSASVLALSAEEATPFKDPEWLRKYEHAWSLLRDRYPEYLDPATPDQIWNILRKHDAWAKVNSPDIWRNPYKILTYCQWEKAAEAEQQANWQREQAEIQAQQKREEAARPQQVSVWKMFVKNKDFQERHADEIAAEIELVQGREAAARFRQKVEADRAAKAASAKDNERVSPSAIYQRSGDRITINGDLSTGYKIRGNQLLDQATGTPTHMRSGGHWVPLNESHPTIYDPP